MAVWLWVERSDQSKNIKAIEWPLFTKHTKSVHLFAGLLSKPFKYFQSTDTQGLVSNPIVIIQVIKFSSQLEIMLLL